MWTFNREKVYCYSENKPDYGANYWRYNSNGQPEIWKSIKVVNVTPNGSYNQETTTEITFVFSENPGNLSTSDFSFSRGEATYIYGGGNTRTVGIDGFDLRTTRSISIDVTPKSDYYFENAFLSSSMYVKLTPITYLNMGENRFIGFFDGDYPTEHIYGERTVLPTPRRTSRRFAGWYIRDGYGGFELIEALPADFHAESVTLYADWKSDLNMENFNGDTLKIAYNMRGGQIRMPDIFIGTGDVSQSDLSYMLRESLFPALSRLSIDGYSYELNLDLIKSYNLNYDVLTIELYEYEFSDGCMLVAEDFIAYYNLILSFYTNEDLPAPWSYIASVTGGYLELEIQFNDYVFDIAYFLHEFRAAPSYWLSDNSINAGSAKEVNNLCLDGLIPSYGKYEIKDYNGYDEICLTANPYYARSDETNAPDISITILCDLNVAMMNWCNGTYDACFNMIEKDIDECGGDAEKDFHKYENRVRSLIGIGKNSEIFTWVEDYVREDLFFLFFRFIASFEIDIAFENSVKEASSWATDALMRMYMGDLIEIKSELTPLSSVEFRLMLEELTNISVDTWLNFTLFVPRNDIYIQIAEIIQWYFNDAYMSLELVYSDNIEGAANCDFCLFPYDFSGYNLFGKDMLSSEYLKYIYFPYNCQNDECYILESRNESFCYGQIGYIEVLDELNAIMMRHCYKLNHIPKGYVSSDDFHNLIYGNVRLIVY